MNAAVSSRIQMNSSTSVAISTLTVPASLRLAIRKIGTLGVARSHRAQQLGRLLVRAGVVVALRPVQQDAVNAGIGCDDGAAVLARECFDDLDLPGVAAPPSAHGRGEWPRCPILRARCPR